MRRGSSRRSSSARRVIEVPDITEGNYVGFSDPVSEGVDIGV